MRGTLKTSTINCILKKYISIIKVVRMETFQRQCRLWQWVNIFVQGRMFGYQYVRYEYYSLSVHV